MKPLSLLYPTGVLLGVFIGTGCPIPYPNHCRANEGNATCAAGGQGTYCSECQMENDGCVDEIPAEDCYFPGPSEDASTSDDGLTSSEATTAAQPTTTDSAEGSTGLTQCASDEGCMDANAPFCDLGSGACVACDEMADAHGTCAARDPDAPLCVGGECVQCTPEHTTVCDADLRVCDGGSNTCVRCTEHGQCSSGACELAEERGQCFPPETTVIHVDGDGGHDHTSIHGAVMSVADGDFGIIVVHELDAAASYTQGLRIDGGKLIAMLAAPGESPIVQGTAGDPGLRVEDATLYAEGLGIMGNTAGRGVEANGAFVWLDRSLVVQNSSGGILAHAESSLTLRNCFVSGDIDFVGVDVIGSSADILYSTVGTLTVVPMPTPSLRCTNPLEVDIRNSIVVSNGGLAGTELDCAGAVVTHSVTEDGGIDFDPGWFVEFNSGSFWLTDAGTEALLDIARWQAGDPATDIDGDSRPTEDGTADYPGADRPSP